MSQKYWITNGACHANHAIVFAQTLVNGKNEGIHAFIVKIRESSMNHVSKMEDMKQCPGVYIEDMGWKIGVNGVDNGRLVFTNVRVPRWAMLNKLAQTDPDGTFHCDIKKASNRFFKVADRLLSGRLCIASMCITSCKTSIYTTIRYSQQRLAVGPTGESDTPIMSYQLQQNALLPLLARTIVLNFGHNAAKQLFARQARGTAKNEEHKIIKILCVDKAMITWQAEINSRICRERTGGAGYLAINLIGDVLNGSHSGCTAEGDNKVLMQKVVKDILADTRKKIHDNIKLSKEQIDVLRNHTSLATDFNGLKTLIYYRETFEIKSMMNKLKDLIFDKEMTFFDVWQAHVNDDIQDLATSFGERFFLQNAFVAYDNCKDAGVKELLHQILNLHMISLIKNDIGWYLSNEIISKESAMSIVNSFDKAVKDFVPHMNDAMEAFNLNVLPNMHAQISQQDYWRFAGGVAQEGEEKLYDFTKPAVQPRM